MRAPSRTRRIAKWAGLVVCVLVLAMWGTSSHYVVTWMSADGSSLLDMGRSMFVVCWDAADMFAMPGWLTIRNEPPVFLGQFWLDPKSQFVAPFWFLLTLAGIPTAILWHRDRRTVKPGCCLTCGYDLRASKRVCPECGVGIVPTAEPKPPSSGG